MFVVIVKTDEDKFAFNVELAGQYYCYHKYYVIHTWIHEEKENEEYDYLIELEEKNIIKIVGWKIDEIEGYVKGNSKEKISKIRSIYWEYIKHGAKELETYVNQNSLYLFDTTSLYPV